MVKPHTSNKDFDLADDWIHRKIESSSNCRTGSQAGQDARDLMFIVRLDAVQIGVCPSDERNANIPLSSTLTQVGFIYAAALR